MSYRVHNGKPAPALNLCSWIFATGFQAIGIDPPQTPISPDVASSPILLDSRYFLSCLPARNSARLFPVLPCLPPYRQLSLS